MAFYKFMVIASLLAALPLALGYNILCVFPMPSNSQDILGKGVVNALLKAGHEVTWMTAYPNKKPVKNLTIIDASESQTIKKKLNLNEMGDMDVSGILKFARSITWSIIQNKDLRQGLEHNNYDAVVTQWFFPDALAGLAATQQIPWITLNPVSMQASLESLVDEVRSVPILPMMLSDYPIPMNFYQRLMNSFMFVAVSMLTWFQRSDTVFMYEQLNEIAEKRGVKLPPWEDALHNISILFLNSHSSFAAAQSLPPNTIEVGGYHIDEHMDPLPKDLQDLLDSSPQGFVYFSMGSILKSSNFPRKTREEILKIFAQLPFTVLWKFEEQMEDLPKNVHIRPWMPQASILAHPNIKLFITHGGLLSTIEAIRFGVPVLAIPMFGDQASNANRAMRDGYAIKVSYSNDMTKELEAALKEMLGNNRYYKKAKYLSGLFNNRPVAPSKLISHYVELAIETKGAYHLRSKAQLYTWYQRWMLDQLAFISISLYILYRTIKKIIQLFVKFVKRPKNEEVKKNL